MQTNLFERREASTNMLFTLKEDYLLSHSPRTGYPRELERLSTHYIKKYTYDNMHWLPQLPVTSQHKFPIVQAYNGSLDFVTLPYKQRKCFVPNEPHLKAVHFFEDDYILNRIWCRLDKTTYELQEYDLLFGPDYSLYASDWCEQENFRNIYKSRFETAVWQTSGMPTIPIGAWGGSSSFTYCFEGLPSNSVIAVCGTGHNINNATRTLWYYGMHRLEEELHPTTIIVYGKEEKIPALHTPVLFIEDYITKHFR